MMPPDRREFLFEQPREDQQRKRMEPSDGRRLVSRTLDSRDQARGAVPVQGGIHQAGPQRIQRSLVRARREVLGTGNRLWACASRSRSIRAVCVSYHCIVRGSRAGLCSNLGPGSPSSGDGSRFIPLFRLYQQSNKPARVNGPGFQGVQFHTSRLSRAIGGEGGRLKCLLGCGGGLPGRSAGPGLRSQGSSGEDGVFALRARGEGDGFPSPLPLGVIQDLGPCYSFSVDNLIPIAKPIPQVSKVLRQQARTAQR